MAGYAFLLQDCYSKLVVLGAENLARLRRLLWDIAKYG